MKQVWGVFSDDQNGGWSLQAVFTTPELAEAWVARWPYENIDLCVDPVVVDPSDG